MKHFARQSEAAGAVPLPGPLQRAGAMPRGGCHVGAPFPAGGSRSGQPALEGTPGSGSAARSAAPGGRTGRAPITCCPPGHPARGENNLPLLRIKGMGAVLLPVRSWAGDTAERNNSHLRGEAQSLGRSSVALPKGMVSVALLRHCAGILSSWGIKYCFGFVFKTLVLKKLRLWLLICLAKKAMPLRMNISTSSPARQRERHISRGLLFLLSSSPPDERAV